MVKLTEIYNGPNEYDPKEKRNKKEYLLRETYVNPSFVVLVKENEELAAESKVRELIPSLSKDVGFTKVLMNMSTSGMNQISVVGAPDSISEKLIG
jgi:hypothetical protein